MSNLPEQDYTRFLQRAAFKSAYAEMTWSAGFTHCLTLAWNRRTSIHNAKRSLSALHARVDERFYGRRFHRRPRLERTLAFFVFEKVETNLHVHSLWRVPSKEKLLPFHRLFPGVRGGVWNSLVPSGTYALSIIDDHHTACGYVMKDQHMGSDDHLVVWSDDFLAK